MADERWERLVEQQGVAYAQTIAGAMNLKLDADNPADREKLRRAILDLVAGRKMPKQKGRGWNSLVLFLASMWQCDSRSEKFSPPSALTEENSASVETTTRLRFPLKFVVDMRDISV